MYDINNYMYSVLEQFRAYIKMSFSKPFMEWTTLGGTLVVLSVAGLYVFVQRLKGPARPQMTPVIGGDKRSDSQPLNKEARHKRSKVYVQCEGIPVEVKGMIIESHQAPDTNSPPSHRLLLSDRQVLEKLANALAIDVGQLSRIKYFEIKQVWMIAADVLEHADLIEFLARQGMDSISCQLRFTMYNDYKEPYDRTNLVTMTFDVSGQCICVKVSEDYVEKPIMIQPLPSGKVYDEWPCHVQCGNSSNYIYCNGKGTLSVGPLTEYTKGRALFTSRQYKGYTKDVPDFPNYQGVTMQLFHEQPDKTVSYVSNSNEDKVILTTRGAPLGTTTLDERDPRFYYMHRIPGSDMCIFMASCFSRHFLSYDPGKKCLQLKYIENPNTIASGTHDDIMFKLRPQRNEVIVMKETSV